MIAPRFGKEHPDIATCYNNLGEAYRRKGEYGKAIKYYDQSLFILQKFLPFNHPNIQEFQKNLSLAQAALEKQNKAGKDKMK